MTEFADLLMKVINEPDTKPYYYEVGQKVRVCKKVLEDGQTPRFWAGAVCEVVKRYASMIHKDHWYKLRHPNGNEDEFREYELDYRYIRKHVIEELRAVKQESSHG